MNIKQKVEKILTEVGVPGVGYVVDWAKVSAKIDLLYRKQMEKEIIAIPFELGTYRQDEFTTIDDMTEIIEQNCIKFFEYRDKILDLLSHKKETK